MPGKTVLIVEDNLMNLELATDLLEANGFTVLQAQNAEVGLRLAREALPDLVLMARFVIVIAEHRDNGDLQDAQLFHQHLRLFRQAEVREVPAQREHISRLANVLEQRMPAALRGLAAVKVRQDSQAHLGL